MWHKRRLVFSVWPLLASDPKPTTNKSGNYNVIRDVTGTCSPLPAPNGQLQLLQTCWLLYQEYNKFFGVPDIFRDTGVNLPL